MNSLETVQGIIKEEIAKIPFPVKPKNLYEPIQYTMELGGKRLRPALCLLACDLFGTEIRFALAPAIGIEIFHNFTLLHDDIMDDAPIRRGKPSVYKKWNSNVAILSGDTMMALSYEYVMQAPENFRSEVFSVFNKTAIEVCEGQQYDMNFETQSDVSINDYLEMIRLKTAVLLAGSLKIGGIIGGASTEDSENLYRFGENIGIAFQLKDDLLDVFSDQDKFGKQTGGDILSNKKTFLYLKAFELAQGRTFDSLYYFFNTQPEKESDKIVGVKEIYKELDIESITLNEIDHYYKNAMEFLNKVNVPNKRKSELIKFSNQLKKREF